MFKNPQLPIAYLLNICVKYPTETKKLTKRALSEIIKLSTAIATDYYNVEHYNQWTQFFQTGETIINFCTEMAVWDSLYSLSQIRPKLSLQILQDLFADFDDERFSKVTGASKAEYFAVISEIFKTAENRNGPTTIFLSNICNK